MNYMKSPAKSPRKLLNDAKNERNKASRGKSPPLGKSNHLRKLSLSVGDFIRYWGFRRIHGAIWTQLYLSKSPLSCTDLTRNLGVSKALVSPALEELCQHKLIFEGPSPNGKTKLYQAAADTSEVIRQVLKSRESVILKQIAKDFAQLNQAKLEVEHFDSSRLQLLGEMIAGAELMLDLFLSQENLLSFSAEIEP